jgi:hypothetical protein
LARNASGGMVVLEVTVGKAPMFSLPANPSTELVFVIGGILSNERDMVV